MSSTQNSGTDTTTAGEQVIDLGDDTLDMGFALDGIVFTRETLVRAIMKLNIRVQRLDDENGPRVYLLGDHEYNRAQLIRLIQQEETRRRRLQVQENFSPSGSASTDNGVDPVTRLTILPNPTAPLIEDDMLTGTAYDQVVLGGERQQDTHCYLPVLANQVAQPQRKPKLGRRIMDWWHKINMQGVIAGMEYLVLNVFGATLIGLTYFLLEHETYVHGNTVNNGTLYDVIGNHLWLTSVGVVLATLVASLADLVIHYKHHRPQGTHQIILMWRAFNLAAFKGLCLLFLGIVTLSILTGTPSIIG